MNRRVRSWARLVAGLCLGGSAECSGEPPAVSATIPPEMEFHPLPTAVPAPAGQPSDALKAALGRGLFFDPILSSSRTVSCATCHDPRFGWTDGRATPIGVGGAGVGPARTFVGSTTLPVLARNVPTLLNVGFNGLVTGRALDPARAPMFWDSRVEGLESQALVPLRTLGEMRGDDVAERDAVNQAVERLRASEVYPEHFQRVFGGTVESAVTAPHLAEVLAAFERSLVTAPAPVDRFLNGDAQALTPEQLRGLRTFQAAGCAECHGGPMFSDYALHVIGVPEVNGEPRRSFRTPTLRNLRRTAPYMHNGRLATIRDVLVFYEALEDTASETLDGGDTVAQPPLDARLQRVRLTPEDFPYLEAFLAALEGEDRNPGAPTSQPAIPGGKKASSGTSQPRRRRGGRRSQGGSDGVPPGAARIPSRETNPRRDSL